MAASNLYSIFSTDNKTANVFATKVNETLAGGIGNSIFTTNTKTHFTYADEFKTLYGVQTADNYMTGEDITALVTKIYENVLDRAPDAGGRDYYVGQITAKSKTVGQVLAEISDSAENKLVVADLIGTGIAYTPWVD